MFLCLIFVIHASPELSQQEQEYVDAHNNEIKRYNNSSVLDTTKPLTEYESQYVKVHDQKVYHNDLIENTKLLDKIKIYLFIQSFNLTIHCFHLVLFVSRFTISGTKMGYHEHFRILDKITILTTPK
jgi:hypothetical protein